MSTAEPSSTERLGRLFDLHQRRLYGLARRLSGDAEEARDLVQESFFRAARRPGSIPPTESGAEAWLVRTLVNLCRDKSRRDAVRRRAAETVLADSGNPSPSPEGALVAGATIRAALRRLPARRRAAVVLHELEGLPVKEVARILGIARVTVRWHLMAARQDLAAELAPLAWEGQETKR
jgi:RNA polymerase sigma-70 factor (ECF subfamily)